MWNDGDLRLMGRNEETDVSLYADLRECGLLLTNGKVCEKYEWTAENVVMLVERFSLSPAKEDGREEGGTIS